MTLSVNRLVKVNLTIAPAAAAQRGFGTLLLIGDSDALGDERFRVYPDIDSLAKDFGIDSEEYKAARLYFSQSPAPAQLMVSRWYNVDIPASITGGAAKTDIREWQKVTSGAFAFLIDGTVYQAKDIDLSGCATMKAAADKIQAAIAAALPPDVKPPQIIWDKDHFSISSELPSGPLESPVPQVDCAALLGLKGGGTASADGTDLVPEVPGKPEEPAQPAVLTGTDVQLDAVKAVTAGAVTISVDGHDVSISGLDFSKCADMAAAAAVLQAGGDLGKFATVTADGDHLVITGKVTGAAAAAPSAKDGTAADTEEYPGQWTAVCDWTAQKGKLAFSSYDNLMFSVDGGTAKKSANITRASLNSAADLGAVAELIQAACNNEVLCSADGNNLIIKSPTKGKNSSVVIEQNPSYANAGNLFNIIGGAAAQKEQGGERPNGVDNKAADKLGLTGGTGEAGKDVTPAVPPVPAVPATHATFTGLPADMTALSAVQDGLLTITADGVKYALDGLDFSADKDLASVAARLSALIDKADVTADNGRLVLTAKAEGAGHAITEAEETLPQRQDISAELGLTAGTLKEQTAARARETPAQVIQTMADLSADWYGVMFAAMAMPEDDELLDAAATVEAMTDTTRILGVTVTDAAVLKTGEEESFAAKAAAAGYSRTCVQYSSSSPYAIASFLGRAFTVNFNGNSTVITMMYKQEPGVTPEDLSETQAQELGRKYCNVFARYSNDTAIVQNGTMASGMWFDERHGSDWLRYYVQSAIWNFVYTRTTKIPQTDAGINSIISVINNCLAQAAANGFVGPGTWGGDGFGALETGQFMSTGYYVYAPSVNDQSAADRALRKAVPIQVAAKLQGALHSFDVAITLER